MNTSSNGYVLGFSIAVCVVISAALAVTANSLRETQAAAAEFDRQKNVMLAAGLIGADESRPRRELEQLYQQRVREQVVDTRTGEVVDGRTPGEVDAMNKEAAKADKADARRYRVVAVTRDPAGTLEAIVLPVSGRGLWSTLYGYLALEADGNRVRGITFYKHGETPGLGGEVENPAWTAQWRGKSIRDEGGALKSIVVKKGKVDPNVAEERQHYVDGLSGATITCNGVTNFVRADLGAFAAFLGRTARN